MAALAFPGGMLPAEFLAEHWQKRPLFMPGALADFAPELTAEELAGLACEDGVEARLVQERPGPRWTLRHGPFATEDFTSLPARGWTLLVQDVDKHLPGIARLIEAFDFLPRWRIEDVMVSCAVADGSVGPHVDEYDVFLLQGPGRRRWQIGTARPEDDTAAGDLALLADFEASQEWVAHCGDVLYLPPGVAHWGVALEPCMTYSIGCRAPSHAEIVSGFAEALAERIRCDARYADPDLTVEEAAGGLISVHAIARLRQILERRLSLDDSGIARWLGEYVTEPKEWLLAQAPEQSLGPDRIAARLRAGARLTHHPMSLFARFVCGGAVFLFVDGDTLEVAPGLTELVALLCSRRRLTARTLGRHIDNQAGLGLLAELYSRGSLVLEQHDMGQEGSTK